MSFLVLPHVTIDLDDIVGKTASSHKLEIRTEDEGIQLHFRDRDDVMPVLLYIQAVQDLHRNEDAQLFESLPTKYLNTLSDVTILDRETGLEHHQAVSPLAQEVSDILFRLGFACQRSSFHSFSVCMIALAWLATLLGLALTP